MALGGQLTLLGGPQPGVMTENQTFYLVASTWLSLWPYWPLFLIKATHNGKKLANKEKPEFIITEETAEGARLSPPPTLQPPGSGERRVVRLGWSTLQVGDLNELFQIK